MRDTYEALCNAVEDSSATDAIGTIANILRDKVADGETLSDEDAATLAKLEQAGF